MVQRRQTDPSRVRHVKRDLATIPKKGVAGLRIEGNTVTTDSNFANHVYDEEQEDSPVFEAENENDGFLSSMSAAHAAIRIANDIIGSTLSLDEPIQTNSRSTNGRAGSSSSTRSRLSSRNGSSSSQESTSTSDQMASNETEDILLDGLDTRGSSRPVDQRAIDLFQQTLDNFRSLTLANIGDFSDSETEDLLL